MLVTDLTLRFDPEFGKISRRFQRSAGLLMKPSPAPGSNRIHRDMGPKSRATSGPEVPKEPDLAGSCYLAAIQQTQRQADIATLKTAIADAGLSVQRAGVGGPGASASRLPRMETNAAGLTVRVWRWIREIIGPVNAVAAKCCRRCRPFRKPRVKRRCRYHRAGRRRGCRTGRCGCRCAGQRTVRAGPGGCRQDQTDIESFDLLEPLADGFRNYRRIEGGVSTETLLLDKASSLTLTAPEMTVLVGGLRVLGANYDGSQHGVFTDRVGVLSNDFFVNLPAWLPSGTLPTSRANCWKARDRQSGESSITATRADLVFGSNSVLRALAKFTPAGCSGETG